MTEREKKNREMKKKRKEREDEEEEGEREVARSLGGCGRRRRRPAAWPLALARADRTPPCFGSHTERGRGLGDIIRERGRIREGERDLNEGRGEAVGK